MKIDNLKKLYRLVKQNDETYCVFDFRMNQVCFEIFYDIGVTPNKIGFLPIDDNRQLWLDVNLGFDVNSRLSHDNYYLLVDILGLKKDPKNKFNPHDFFIDFNNRIPDKYRTLNKTQRARIVNQVYNVEESEKTVYVGMIEWDKLESKKSRTFENLEKTRLLYPELYESIKNKNISIKYTSPIE